MTTISAQADNMNDNTQSISGSGETHTGNSSSDEQSTSENNFSLENHDKNLGADSRFILIQQDGKFSMFEVMEGNEALDADLPHKIRPIAEYDTQGAAIIALAR